MSICKKLFVENKKLYDQQYDYIRDQILDVARIYVVQMNTHVIYHWSLTYKQYKISLILNSP